MTTSRSIVMASGFVLLIVIIVLNVVMAEQPPSSTAATEVAEDSESVNRDYMNAELPIEQRVELLLSQMTLAEKVGQMTQSGFATTKSGDVHSYLIGSVLSGGGDVPNPNTAEAWMNMFDDYQQAALRTRLQIPILYGIDAVHGHNNVYGATIFPHNIGLGATRDASLAERIGAATAKEVRATGLQWTFAPTLAVPLDERWGRTYEGFAEDPEVVAELGTAFITGFQGEPGAMDFLQEDHIIATAKHWVGDGATKGGVDRGNIELTEEQLAYYMLPYQHAIEAGVRTVMVSFSSWNGLKTHADPVLITNKLKGELGFDGIVISDWEGISEVSNDYRIAVKESVNAGIDLFMVPTSWKKFVPTLIELVENGDVPMSRIDDAVTRILRVKFEAGLFEKPLADRKYLQADILGAPAHRELAREAVRKSLVLLKNSHDLLPLAKDSKIFVAGRHADDIGLQAGGWTITWQGAAGDITPGTTILAGIQDVAGETQVTYSRDGHGAEGHDVAIVVVGEEPYAEMHGDRDDLSLSEEDRQRIANVSEAGIPVVIVLISGRPMIVTEELEQADAFVAAWLPGTEGAGVADVLFGDYPFSGKLSYTWPKSMEQIPLNLGDEPYEPLFPYGYGLE